MVLLPLAAVELERLDGELPAHPVVQPRQRGSEGRLDRRARGLGLLDRDRARRRLRGCARRPMLALGRTR